jgi:hypothetical protein
VTQEYESHVYFWEVIDLLRRTVLGGWVLLIDEANKFSRLLVALFVSVRATSRICLLSMKSSPRRLA